MSQRASDRSDSQPPVAPVEDSREKILDVAEALFATRGFGGVGLQGVAVGVGMRKSSLFHHFPSKMALYLAVLERVLARVSSHVDPILNLDATPTERLDMWVDALIDSLVEHPTTARLCLRALFEEATEEVESEQALAVDRALAHVVGSFDRILREGVAAGAFQTVSVPDTIQTLIGATVYHFASGEFGEALTGAPLFQSEAVRRRKEEVKRLLHGGLLEGQRDLARIESQ